MRKVFLFFVLSLSFISALAQSDLQKKYRSFQFSGHYQTASYAWLWSGDEVMYHLFNAEIGFGYQFQLGASHLYFETGGFLGIIPAKFLTREGGNDSTLTSTSGKRFKLPLLIDYLFPVSNSVILYPSFGLGVCVDAQQYSYIDYEDSDYNESGNEIAYGGILPHVGLNAIVSNKYIIGLGWEQYWNTGQMPRIQSVLFKAGIVF